MEVERWEKIAGLVRQGAKSESDVGVGVTLEVRTHRFKKSYNGGIESGKNRGVGKARSKIGI